MKDLEFVETRLERNPPAAEKAVLERIKAHLEGEGLVAEAGLTPEELQLIESHAFVTAKPWWWPKRRTSAAFDNFLVRVVSASGYISFLTVGGSENRAWLIRKGATAQEAGGAIHTDIQKGFIRAEIIAFDDFVAAGGETQQSMRTRCASRRRPTSCRTTTSRISASTKSSEREALPPSVVSQQFVA